MHADPHASLFLLEQEAFDAIYGTPRERKLLADGYRLVETRRFAFAKKHGRQLVPMDGFITMLTIRLRRRQSNNCAYCERPFNRKANASPKRKMTIDHRVPLSKGGTWKRNNLVLVCERCNKAKADLSEEVFRELLSTHGWEKMPRAARSLVSQNARQSLQASFDQLPFQAWTTDAKCPS